MLYFSGLHDRSAPVFSQTGPSDSPEFRKVLLGSSVVASLLVLLAWCVYFWLFPGMSVSLDLDVTSDVSSSLGFGAYFNGEWFSG